MHYLKNRWKQITYHFIFPFVPLPSLMCVTCGVNRMWFSITVFQIMITTRRQRFMSLPGLLWLQHYFYFTPPFFKRYHIAKTLHCVKTQWNIFMWIHIYIGQLGYSSLIVECINDIRFSRNFARHSDQFRCLDVTFTGPAHFLWFRSSVLGPAVILNTALAFRGRHFMSTLNIITLIL